MSDIAETLWHWLEAINANPEQTFSDAALFNGGCLTEDIETGIAEIKRLRKDNEVLAERGLEIRAWCEHLMSGPCPHPDGVRAAATDLRCPLCMEAEIERLRHGIDQIIGKCLGNVEIGKIHAAACALLAGKQDE